MNSSCCIISLIPAIIVDIQYEITDQTTSMIARKIANQYFHGRYSHNLIKVIGLDLSNFSDLALYDEQIILKFACQVDIFYFKFNNNWYMHSKEVVIFQNKAIVTLVMRNNDRQSTKIYLMFSFNENLISVY